MSFRKVQFMQGQLSDTSDIASGRVTFLCIQPFITIFSCWFSLLITSLISYFLRVSEIYLSNYLSEIII